METSQATKNPEEPKEPHNHKDTKGLFTNSVAFTGGDRLGSKTKVRRHTWLIIIIVACIACSIHLYFVVAEFQEYAVNTLVEQKEFQFEFPDVTLCATAAFSKRKRDAGAKTGLSSAQRFWFETYKRKLRLAVDDLDSQEASFKRAIYSFNSLPDKDDILVDILNNVRHCSYKGNPCTWKNFTSFNSVKRFHCITLAPESRAIVLPDKQEGLHLVISTGDGFAENDPNSALHEIIGYEMVIHSPGTMPQIGKDSQIIQPGSQVTVKVKKNTFTKVDTPKTPCYSDIDLQNIIIASLQQDPNIFVAAHNFRNNYSEADCFQIMTSMTIIQKCKCISESFDMLFEWNSTYPKCHELPQEFFFNDNIDSLGNLTYGNKTFNIYKNERAKKIAEKAFCVEEYTKDMFTNKELEEKLKQCPSRCFKSEYDQESSIINWPQNKTQVMSMLNSINPAKVFTLQDPISSIDEIDKMVSIIIYPSDLSVQETSESLAYPISQLFSDFGGNMGLWIGVSLLTVAEVVEFLFLIILRLLQGKRMKTTAHDAEENGPCCAEDGLKPDPQAAETTHTKEASKDEQS